MNKVLVVDDEVDILLAVKLILTNSGFAVETTPKWENINHQIDSFKPDVILLDVSLSGADGRDICYKLKKTDKTKHIPIVLISAHYNLVNNLKECKPDAVITKPFDIKNLVNTVASCLN